jgi:subtilisin family serine protease
MSKDRRFCKLSHKLNSNFQKTALVSAVSLGILITLQQPVFAATYPYQYSPQNGLMGLNNDIWTSANYGAGITYGVIDTGVAAPWIGFQSRIDTVNAACTFAGCTQAMALADDNGHGTFVASEIIGDLRNFGLTGIAPSGRVLPVKVLNAQGSGYTNDVASGIVYAADHGANILNLSISFIPTPDIINAINYAASKNNIIVFAGGNSAKALLGNSRIAGFTDAAIKRMLFMGSTNLQQKISYFSNTPGTGGFVSTTNKFYSLASRWMMADGENIWGASTYHDATGYDYITQMSGTSMAAPQAAGAAGLLAARWPFLLSTGKVTDILLSSTQDLGARGIDTTYGDGYIRIDKAFNPIGTLTVPVNGKNVLATNAAIVPSTAVGGMSAVSSALSKAVGYDRYSRDFAIYLPAAILAPVKTASTASAKVSGQTGAKARSLTALEDGAWLASSLANIEPAASDTDSGAEPSHHLIQDPTRPDPIEWSVGFQQKDGSYIGAGHDGNAALSFNDARWGNETAFFNNEDSMAGSLLGLTSTASFAAVGMDLNSHSRLAFGSIDSTNNNFTSLSGVNPNGQGVAVSYTTRPLKNWTFSASGSMLKEDNMLLGAIGGGYLGFGKSSTIATGVGASVDLGKGYHLGIDSIAASTSPSRSANSLVTGTSRLTSAGFSFVLNKTNLTGHNDDIGFSFRKPLRVYSGFATVDVPMGTDHNGTPIIQSSRVPLAPTGNESDLNLNYKRPLDNGAVMGFSLAYRHDADNVKGAKDAAVMVRYSSSF